MHVISSLIRLGSSNCRIQICTHVGKECTTIPHELTGLLCDLDPGLTIVSTCGDDRARGPELVNEFGVELRNDQRLGMNGTSQLGRSVGGNTKDTHRLVLRRLVHNTVGRNGVDESKVRVLASDVVDEVSVLRHRILHAHI